MLMLCNERIRALRQAERVFVHNAAVAKLRERLMIALKDRIRGFAAGYMAYVGKPTRRTKGCTEDFRHADGKGAASPRAY